MFPKPLPYLIRLTNSSVIRRFCASGSRPYSIQQQQRKRPERAIQAEGKLLEGMSLYMPQLKTELVRLDQCNTPAQTVIVLVLPRRKLQY